MEVMGNSLEALNKKQGEEILNRFKEEVWKYAVDHTFKKTAKKFGIHHSTVSGWVKESEKQDKCANFGDFFREKGQEHLVITGVYWWPEILMPKKLIINFIQCLVILNTNFIVLLAMQFSAIFQLICGKFVQQNFKKVSQIEKFWQIWLSIDLLWF